jgi:glycosyltransferase involved in cell wall biosynthesis
MKVLHVAKYDLKGGAALAAYSSMRAQRALGLDAVLSVGRKLGSDPHVRGPSLLGDKWAIARFAAEQMPARLIGVSRHDTRSIGLFGRSFASLSRGFHPDVVVLHSVDGVLSLGEIERIPHPVIWRMHDMWAIAGHRHYEGGYLPGPKRLYGLAERLDKRLRAAKLALPRRRQMLYCPPSQWLAREASEALGPEADVAVVPNGIDTDNFRPVARGEARAALGIQHKGPLVLFGSASGSSDRRKGGDLLLEALAPRRDELEARNIKLCLLGGEWPVAAQAALPVISLGRISDRGRLRLAYSACDVTIVPSREENLSLMVLESLACGTPVVAFAIGGMPDMIEHGRNGWLVPEVGSAALGEALLSLDCCEAMRQTARASVIGRFDRESEARGMLALFERLIGTGRSVVGRAQAR